MTTRHMDVNGLIMMAASKQQKYMNRVIHEMGYKFEFAHFKILMTATHFPQTLYARELVIIEGKSKSTINALLTRLEKNQLISIESCSDDKRLKSIKVTKLGRNICSKIENKIKKIVIPTILEGVSRDEQKLLSDLVVKLLNNLDIVLKEDSSFFTKYY